MWNVFGNLIAVLMVLGTVVSFVRHPLALLGVIALLGLGAVFKWNDRVRRRDLFQEEGPVELGVPRKLLALAKELANFPSWKRPA